MPNKLSNELNTTKLNNWGTGAALQTIESSAVFMCYIHHISLSFDPFIYNNTIVHITDWWFGEYKLHVFK